MPNLPALSLCICDQLAVIWKLPVHTGGPPLRPGLRKQEQVAVTGSGQVRWAAVAGAPARMGSLWGLALTLYFCCWQAGAPGSSAGKRARGLCGLLSWQGSDCGFVSWQPFVGECSSLGLIIINHKAVCEVLLLLIKSMKMAVCPLKHVCRCGT